MQHTYGRLIYILYVVWDGPRCLPRHLTYPQMSYPSFDSLRSKSPVDTAKTLDNVAFGRVELTRGLAAIEGHRDGMSKVLISHIGV